MRTLEELVAGYRAKMNWANATLEDPDKIYSEDSSDEDIEALEREVSILLDADREFVSSMSLEELKILVNSIGVKELTKEFYPGAKRRAMLVRILNPRSYFEQMAMIALNRLTEED